MIIVLFGQAMVREYITNKRIEILLSIRLFVYLTAFGCKSLTDSIHNKVLSFFDLKAYLDCL